MSCGVGHRHGLDPSLLWLWWRPAAVALSRPLAWELLYVTGVALKSKKKKKLKVKRDEINNTFFWGGAFLRPHPRHMVVPRLGSNRSCSCQPTPWPQQCRIQATSVIYSIALAMPDPLTHWARPGIELASPWIQVGFITTEPRWELLDKAL